MAERKRVLVVGSGIAGMGVSQHLAEMECDVYLVEQGPAIGGSMHLLDHTFPTDSCGLCLMGPVQPAYCPTLECEAHKKIHLLPYSQVKKVDRKEGTYQVRIQHKARYVDVDKCTDCGICATVCPETRPHDHEGWLGAGKAIYRPAGLRAVPAAWVIDMEYCTRCGECVQACPEGAVDLEMEGEEGELKVKAVVLAPGYKAYDARQKGAYGYGVSPNVMTALEFERMVSLAGSGQGRVVRASDGKAAKRVAFIQCVGSRDPEEGLGHCSTVCCMYTAKQVKLAKKMAPELEVTVYHMDLRAQGKGYEKYMTGVQNQPGVNYIRSMPSKVHEMQRTKELQVVHVGEDGKLQEAEYDIVVLAVGFGPPEGMGELARELGVELNEYNYPAPDGYHPGREGKAGVFLTGGFLSGGFLSGVFLSGAYREPKDIPETVMEAAAVAAEVAGYLGVGYKKKAQAGGSARSERELSEEEPQVGVFTCECGGELGVTSPENLTRWAAGQPGVVVARTVKKSCTAEGLAEIAEAVAGEKLNRVVIAGCGAKVYQEGFEGLMRDAGLDPRLMARVPLLEQVVYPHRGNGYDLEGKARSLLGMAVAGQRAMNVSVLAPGEVEGPEGGALVVGGGAAGMRAALGLAKLGERVTLVEQAGELGGEWRRIRYQADGSDVAGELAALVGAVESIPEIQLHLRTTVRGIEGKPGHYKALLEGPEGSVEAKAGAVILATGGREASTEEYQYGRDPRVLTQRELEEQLSDGTLARVQRVVMVQCVGSREEGREYCSRVCCTQAVKNALRLKAEKPEIEVYILYREIRTYGYKERYYEAARKAGVVFLRYELPDKPDVQVGSGGLIVGLRDLVVGRQIQIQADLVVLSVGIEGAGDRGLAAELEVGLDGDHFYAEEHNKMKPLDLGRGVYVAGLAHSPRFLEETLVQGAGAAMRAASYLGAEVAERASAVWVNERLCSYCGLCEEACPYGARVKDKEERVVRVVSELCAGCGVCAMVCPNKATLQKGQEHKQLLAALDMALI